MDWRHDDVSDFLVCRFLVFVQVNDADISRRFKPFHARILPRSEKHARLVTWDNIRHRGLSRIHCTVYVAQPSCHARTTIRGIQLVVLLVLYTFEYTVYTNKYYKPRSASLDYGPSACWQLSIFCPVLIFIITKFSTEYIFTTIRHPRSTCYRRARLWQNYKGGLHHHVPQARNTASRHKATTSWPMYSHHGPVAIEGLRFTSALSHIPGKHNRPRSSLAFRS